MKSTLVFITSLLVLLTSPMLLNAKSTTIHLGPHNISSNEKTNTGTAVVPMWNIPMPKSETDTGYPPAKDAHHFHVWRSNVQDGGFNHHPALIHFDGYFFAMWSNHPQGEDAPGQRVLFSISKDAETWAEPRVLFAAPSEVKKRKESGMSMRPERWIVVGDTLYGIAHNRAENALAMGRGAKKAPSTAIARAVRKDGSVGPPFVLAHRESVEHLPIFMRNMPDATTPPPEAQKIAKAFRDAEVISWWAQSAGEVPKRGIDTACLIEPFIYRAKDGQFVLMMRSHPSALSRQQGNTIPRNNRIYVSFQDADGKWPAPYPTDIPDSPSRAEALRLPNGDIVLIGNQIAPRFDTRKLYMSRHTLTAAVSPDGYHFDRVYALRDKAPSQYRFNGIEGRTLGYGYPSSIIHDGYLYSLYSVGKEDIAITKVPLQSLGTPEK